MDTQKPQSDAKSKFSFYEGFDGHYHKVGELRDLIPQFRAFYLAERRKEPTKSAIKVINEFNQSIAPRTFFPWEKQYRLWRKKWDAELIAERGYREEQRIMRQLVNLRDEQKVAIAPDEYTLEAGARTLGGELLNDALTILKGDQESEDAYDDDIIVKRRNYVLNVFNYVMRATHNKESLNLKSNADKRETADFMMMLMKSARAGKLTAEDMELIRGSVKADTSAS